MGWKSRRIVRGPGEREREKKNTSSKGVEGKIITICKKNGWRIKVKGRPIKNITFTQRFSQM